MAITRVQSKVAQTGTTNSIACTYTSPPTNGNCLIAFVSVTSPTVTVTGIASTGATWSLLARFADATSGTTGEFWSAPNVSGAGSTVTASLSGSPAGIEIAIFEYSGINGVLDKSASATTAGTSPTSGTTASTTVSSELWLSGFTTISLAGSGVYSAPTNSYAIASQQNNNDTLEQCICEKIVAATGTAGCGVTLAADTSFSTGGLSVSIKTASASSAALYVSLLGAGTR